ncbi:Cu(I)-responsive transcriptional regulator [Devosia naphthalenivorans]|uniref:Cu(I)-responsive transcriptional regulator n=1 Tax=Devosia naphthalenivorans TaxID=2082392 RepID=UPI000D3B674A|nr:Cu(I)-responsive transcriptional regulator [Devosia naphthalenivorans]
MNIGEASKASGVSTKMIRYYESIGLISAPLRTESGYRVYSDNEVHGLRFISRARDLGFSVEQMGDLLALWRDRSRASADVKSIALEHIRVLDEKAKALKAMSDTLRHLADNCHGDGRPDCPIIEGFAQAAPTSVKKRQPRFGVTDIAPDRSHA